MPSSLTLNSVDLQQGECPQLTGKYLTCQFSLEVHNWNWREVCSPSLIPVLPRTILMTNDGISKNGIGTSPVHFESKLFQE